VAKITELHDQRTALSAELTTLRSSIADPAEATDEQVAQLSELRGKIDDVSAKINKAEGIRSQLESMQESLESTAPQTFRNEGITAQPKGFSPFSIPKTVASMVERDAKRGLVGDARRVYGENKHLATIGAQFIGALRGDQSCRDAVQASYHEFEATQNTQQNSLGGFLVPDDLVPTLIDLRERYGVIRRTASVMNVSAPSGSIPRRTGRPSAVFIGEPRTSDIGTGDLTFDSINYQVKPLASFTPSTFELEQDSLINISALVFMHAAEDFAYTEDNCAFNGTGTAAFGGIRGILNILDDAAYAGSNFVTTGESTLATVTNGSLANATGVIPDYSDVGSNWFVSKRVNGAVFDRLKLTAGGNTVQNIEGRTVRQYNGYGIEISQVLPTTPGTGAIFGLYGNMGLAAHLFSKGGILMERSEHAQFMRAQIVYRTIQRFDFVFHERGTATTAGPLIALELA
jgi:HK97 family phage major capsid protein